MSGQSHQKTPAIEEGERTAGAQQPELDPQGLYGNSFLQEQMRAQGDQGSGSLLDIGGVGLPEGGQRPLQIDEWNPYTDQPVPDRRSTRLEIDEENPYAPAAPRLTKPTAVKSTLGTTMVYPDDHKGPLPKGAVRQSEHEKMVGIISRIENGSSQLTIDTSNFTDGIDPEKEPKKYKEALAEAEAFRKQQTGYLKDLVKTPTGLKLLEELGSSKHKTKIERGLMNETDDEDEEAALMRPITDGTGRERGMTRGEGTDTTVRVDPSQKTFFDPKRERSEEPWQTDRPRYGLYHELVHAYHSTRGDTIPGATYPGGPAKTERQTVGKAKADAKSYAAGGYPDEEVSENAIRRDFGKPERPEY